MSFFSRDSFIIISNRFVFVNNFLFFFVGRSFATTSTSYQVVSHLSTTFFIFLMTHKLFSCGQLVYNSMAAMGCQQLFSFFDTFRFRAVGHIFNSCRPRKLNSTSIHNHRYGDPEMYNIFLQLPTHFSHYFAASPKQILIKSAICAYTTNMNKLKSYTFLGIIFVVIAGTISHFIYEWSGNNFILGFFFPVNESTWEHMKLCFFPMLLYSCFMNFRIKENYPCATSSLLFGILLATFLIPVIFYTYTGIIGRNNLFLDIATFIVSVILGFLAVYRLTLSCGMLHYTFCLGICVFALAFAFLIFTYHPPDIGLFISPTFTSSSNSDFVSSPHVYFGSF